MKINLLVLDVDGTLTDSRIYYGDNNLELKSFSTKDGAILKPLGQLGIDVIFLTGRESEAVSRRAKDLNAIAIQDISKKADELKKIVSDRNISLENVAYIGDDLNDYTAMSLCKFKACPSDAAKEIKTICNYVSPFPGGHGAVRDICEKILKDAGIWGDFLKVYR